MIYLLIFIFLSLIPVVFSTTVLAAKCSDGIVLIADRLSGESLGKSVVDRNAVKICILSDYTAIASVSNNLGEFKRLYESLMKAVREHDYENDGQSVLRTMALSTYCRSLVYKKYPMNHVIICGYDDPIDESYLEDIEQDPTRGFMPSKTRKQTIGTSLRTERRGNEEEELPQGEEEEVEEEEEDLVIDISSAADLVDKKRNNKKDNKDKQNNKDKNVVTVSTVPKDLFLFEILPQGTRVCHEMFLVSGQNAAYVTSLVEDTVYRHLPEEDLTTTTITTTTTTTTTKNRKKRERRRRVYLPSVEEALPKLRDIMIAASIRQRQSESRPHALAFHRRENDDALIQVAVLRKESVKTIESVDIVKNTL
jgi:hypothetical protein